MNKPAQNPLRNIAPKLLALLSAIVFWYFLRGITSHEITIEGVPIEFKVPDGMAVLQPSAETVDVLFQGSQDDLRLLDRKQIKLTLPLKTNDIAETKLEIKTKYIQAPGSARALRFTPNTIAFQLDRKTEKLVAVKARQTGKPLLGEVTSITCEPSAITVWGPEKHVETLETIRTEPVDVDGRIAGFSKSVRVLRPEGGWVSDISPAEVRVTVTIKEQSETRELPDIPVLALLRPGATYRPSITPARVTVRLTGHPDTLDKILQHKPRVFVDCADLESGMPYELPLNVGLNPDQNVTALTDPRFVGVTLELGQP